MRNPNGYGSITKLSGKRRNPYMVRIAPTYTSDGKKLKETRPVLGYFHTRKEAMQALAEYNRSPYQLSDKPTFGEIYAKWITEKEKDGISGSRIKGYNAAFEKCREIQDMPIIDCKLQEFQNIVDRYKEKSSTCVNTIKTVIQGICGYAMRYDIIPKDYSDYIIVRSTESTEDKHRPFTIEEINALWNEPQDDVRDIVLILLYSGWRINELLDLDSLDLDNGIMTGGKKTKAGKNRIVPIHHRIEPLIREYKNGFGHKYLWFQTRIKDRYDHLPHDTRHTFISRLQSAGADRICIERLVGHASQSITDNVYTHKDVDDLRECIELLT